MISNRNHNGFDNFVNQMTEQYVVSPRNQPLAPLNYNQRNVSPRKQNTSPLINEQQK